MRRIRPYISSTFIILLATALPAVGIIAYLFGFRPALVAIGVSVILGRPFFIEPLHPLLFPPVEARVFYGILVLFSASLAMFMENLRQARQAAELHAALARGHLEKLEHETTERQRERSWSDWQVLPKALLLQTAREM